MAIVAAQDKARAAVLRDNVGLVAITTAGTYVNGVALMQPIPELNLTLEPQAQYAIDGMLAYNTGTTPAIKFTFSIPPGASGMWSLQAITNPGFNNNVEAIRRNTFNVGGTSEAGAGGSASFDVVCMPIGYIRTSFRGGTLQFYFAQATSNASTTAVLAGSWIRITKVG